ncbi:tetratricopeptide repeat protein [Actinosynnema sp. NPDC023587]|uniref:ATP-binding protein n=1 Tax=Actinosynnema sp. NPDC023587 TaxID=3154695 RepID=UPI0034010838
MPDDGVPQETDDLVHDEVLGNVVRAMSVGGVHFHGRGTEPPPQQLLHDIAQFTGRGEQVQKLCALVEEGLRGDSSAIVISTLTGQGGVGKTALATHVGHLLRERFPDGQMYADLRGVAPDSEVRTAGDVLGEFLRALHVDGELIPEDASARASLFRSQVAGKRMLLLLDNAKDEAQVRPLLPGRPFAVVLVTSRKPLAGLEGARRVRLEVMDRTESIKLFTRLVGARRVARESGEAASIADLCGGLPLAITICGARLVAQPELTLRRLRILLQDEKRTLGVLRAGDLDVRACFSLSYRHMITDSERRAFRMLGLIDATAFTDWVLGPLLACSQVAAEEAAEGLAAAHLIETVAETVTGQSRYRFHDLVRAYAREVGADRDSLQERIDAVDRLVRAYIELTSRVLESYEPTGPNEVVRHVPSASWDSRAERLLGDRPAEWFADEVPNLVDVVELGARFERWEPTWRLCEVLIPLLEVSSRWTEWEKVVAAGLVAARHTDSGLAEAAMLRRRGDLMLYTKRRREGREDLRKSAEIFRTLDALGPCAAALVRLGEAHRYLGDRQEALEHMMAARLLYRDLGDELGESYAWSTIGGVYRADTRWDDAIAAFRDALPVLRARRHRRQTAITLLSLGDAYHLKAQWNDAMECFNECNEIFRELGDTMWQANTARHIGIIDSICGRKELARKRFDAAMSEFKRIGDDRKLALTLWNIGELLADDGKLDDAMSVFGQARETFVSLGDLFCGALVEDSIAWSQARHGNLDEVKSYLDRSIENADNLNQSLFRATAHISLAQYHVRRGRQSDAKHAAKAGLKTCRVLGARRWEAVALDLLAQACLQDGDMIGATLHWQEAVFIFRYIDMPRAAADVQERLTAIGDG